MLAFEQKLHQYTSLYKCFIPILKCYGVNKDSLLTTSYFLTNQVVSITGSTGYQRKSRVLKVLKLLWFYGQ